MDKTWTRARVADRLELAADVMKSAPDVKPQGYFNSWPVYLSTWADQVGQEPRSRRPLPSARMITEADEALLWLRWRLWRRGGFGNRVARLSLRLETRWRRRLRL